MKTFSTRASDQNGPAYSFVPVTPQDDADLPEGLTRGLFVGGAGAVLVRDAAGHEVTIISASAQYHPLRVARVLATGTTAAGLVALY